MKKNEKLKEKLEKTKTWISDHKEILLSTGLIAVGCGLLAYSKHVANTTILFPNDNDTSKMLKEEFELIRYSEGGYVLRDVKNEEPVCTIKNLGDVGEDFLNAFGNIPSDAAVNGVVLFLKESYKTNV